MTNEEREQEEISKAMSKAAKWGHKKNPRGRKFYVAMQKKRMEYEAKGELSPQRRRKGY